MYGRFNADARKARFGAAVFRVVAMLAMASGTASAAPSAELAKRCLRATYKLYPYQRPGAAPMTGDRLSFFKECMAGRQDGASPDPAK